MIQKIFLLCFLFIACHSQNPIVVFHGIRDSCTGVQSFTNQLASQLNVYVECIETGEGEYSWLYSIPTQLNTACEAIKANPNFFGKDIDVVGLSQGNLIARGIIQKCDFNGTVKKYLAVGGPQMGVYAIPECYDNFFCNIVNFVVRQGVYLSIFQNHIAPANYFKDAKSYKSYLDGCKYLPDLNNERPEKNSTHKERFGGLEALMLVKFNNDTTVIPKESAWFGFYDSNLNLVDMTETQLYQEDFIGLKKLDLSGKVKRVELPGGHMHYTKTDIENIFVPFLRQ